MEAHDLPEAPSAGSRDAPAHLDLSAPVAVHARSPSTASSSAPASPAPPAHRGASAHAQATVKSISAPPMSPATSPNPLPVASTSSSPAPSPSSAPASPSPTSPRAAQPQKKVVLLRRPSSPVPAPATARVASPPAGTARPGDAVVADIARRTGELRFDESADAVGSAAREARADRLPPLDPVLHAALNHPRDRLLLLRAEVEMERFVSSTSSSRLPLAPPHFPPGLNSYQRLLIHRLADMFGITREVEAAPPALWNAGMINPSTGQSQGVVVLVKGDASQPPVAKLATYVPAPEVPSPAAASAATPPNLPSRPQFPSAVDSPAPSVASTPAPTVPPPVFKILPRSAASRGASSTASSVIGEDDGNSSVSTGTSGKGRGRRELTLLEREAAYKEARERIFAQSAAERAPPAPPSVASSVAGGEDAASVQSAGYGITRPSSAGSTFSRSSAALSVSGQRPPPSLASESSSSIRSGYVGGGYYAPPSVQQPHYGMRPAAPSFDPATGSWTYGQPAGGAPPVPEFAYPYAGGASQPPYHHPSSAYGAYPPPPPPPLPAPHGAYDPSPPAAAWARGLPSPALSSSSGGSLQQFPPFPPVSQGAPPSAPSEASTGSSAGYLMRFPEGAVVTPGGGVVGPPAPYATVAGSAGTAFRSPAAPSASGSSASLSSQAARSAESYRRLSAGTRRSPEASVAGRSDAGSSTGRSEAASASADGRRRGRQTTIVAPRGEGAGAGEKGAEQPAAAAPARPHPSLPAKPAWVASQPPLERPAPVTPASVPPVVQKSAPVLAPPPPPPPQQVQFAAPPYAPPPPGHANGAAGYQAYAPPPPPPGAGVWTRPSAAAPPFAPPPSAYGASVADYPALPLNGAPPPFYPPPGGLAQGEYPAHPQQYQHQPPPMPPPAWQTHAAAGVPPAHVGAPHTQAFASAPADGLLAMPEMRRPPPRNTQLFDPNKPGGGGGGGGAMRRGGSGAGQGRRV